VNHIITSHSIANAFLYTMAGINTQYLEEIKCKIVPKPERNTKTVIGGGENYGKRPLFVGHGNGLRRYSCGNCNLVLIDNVGENIRLVNIVLKCPDCQSYNELPA
jgi:hypothetical protein